MRFIQIAIVAFVLAVCSGCAAGPKTFQPTNAAVDVGGSFQGTWGHLESAKYDYGQAKKFMKVETGLHFMDAGEAEVDSAFAKLTDGMKAAALQNLENGKMRDQMVVCDAELKIERSQRLGDRTHKLAGWIVAIATGGSLVLLVLHFCLGGSLLGALPFTAIFKRILGKA